MNIIRKGVKELLLVPVNMAKGAVDAIDETVNGKKDDKKQGG